MIPPRPRDMNRGQMPGGWWTSRRRSPWTRWKSALASVKSVPLATYLAALRSGRQLVRTQGAATSPRGAGIVAVVTYRDDAVLLPAFLSHHRALLVGLFVFLDLSADSHLAADLRDEPDCIVWRPSGAGTRRPTPWSNFLRHRYAAGCWCLSLEACDFLVFSRCETRSFRSLTDFLQTEHRDHLYALVVEMYGGAPGGAIVLEPGQTPLEAMPFFDPIGYLTRPPADDGTVPTLGGVQRRMLFKAMPAKAPRLDRIPLVKWRRRYAYVEGTRVVRPSRLNAPHASWHTSPTACLLRFSLLSRRDGTGRASGRALAAGPDVADQRQPPLHPQRRPGRVRAAEPGTMVLNDVAQQPSLPMPGRLASRRIASRGGG